MIRYLIASTLLIADAAFADNPKDTESFGQCVAKYAAIRPDDPLAEFGASHECGQQFFPLRQSCGVQAYNEAGAEKCTSADLAFWMAKFADHVPTTEGNTSEEIETFWELFDTGVAACKYESEEDVVARTLCETKLYWFITMLDTNDIEKVEH